MGRKHVMTVTDESTGAQVDVEFTEKELEMMGRAKDRSEWPAGVEERIERAASRLGQRVAK